MFTRSVNVGGGEKAETEQDLADLVDCWTVLVDITGFLQVSQAIPSLSVAFANEL
jgi:nuclear pore complex protein Nup205